MIRSKISRILLTLLVVAIFCAIPFYLGRRGNGGNTRAGYYLGNPQIPLKEDAEKRFSEAVKYLKQGKSFEVAMAQLEEAVRQEPGNSKYHLALGCAYADRAASLGYAESFTPHGHHYY